MNKRWIGSLAVCIFMLAISVPPSLARLNEGKFVAISRAQANMDDNLQAYQIRSGDTLWDISNKYNTSVANLMSINRLDKDSVLDIGKTIKVPGQKGAVHVVASGETMWAIASHYKISVDNIVVANRDKDPNSLNIGDRLVIPASDRSWAAKSSLEPSRNLSISSMIWPVVGTITSSFGWRSSGFHHGLDIAVKKGTPICAAAAGTVSFVGYNSIYGWMVIINHPDGKKTVYAHTKNIYVSNKQKVYRGEKIATVGTSGNTTGPHLHFEVRYKDKTYNPLRYLR